MPSKFPDFDVIGRKTRFSRIKIILYDSFNKLSSHLNLFHLLSPTQCFMPMFSSQSVILSEGSEAGHFFRTSSYLSSLILPVSNTNINIYYSQSVDVLEISNLLNECPTITPQICWNI